MMMVVMKIMMSYHHNIPNILSFSCLPGNNEPLLCAVGQHHNVSGHALSLLFTFFVVIGIHCFLCVFFWDNFHVQNQGDTFFWVNHYNIIGTTKKLH